MDIAVRTNKSANVSGQRRKRRWLPALACCGFLGIGVAVGAILSRDTSSATDTVDLSLEQSTDWIDDVCANFRIFGRKYQPITDIGPEDPVAVSDLVQRTTGLDIGVPTFDEGARIFEGARIVAIERTPGVELFYRNNAGDLLSVFILARPATLENQITDVQETIRDNLTVAWWQGERALIAIVGPSSDTDMPALAQSAYLKL
ncbi:hypothetical protein [Martelella radicis]|uniref:Uncharacterized protein n=1 Tax=Martelella radicis TaxID=1397476 RepID=A0A7W6KK89_9HYPH|nr:hypothetical protein [Martelella radicis]MBB4121448.1 hypothetical protein [Martelella radicis]